MKTNLVITDKNPDFASFNPVSGTFDLNLTSNQLEEISVSDVEDAIAAELSAKHGFKIGVQAFQSNGHEITGETPSTGSFIATRH